MTLDAQIEAVLFWNGEPMKVSKLASIFDISESEIEDALQILEAKLAGGIAGVTVGEEREGSGRGVVLVRKDGEVMLGTHPDAGELLEKLAKENLSKDLGKAALETLTTILYKGPLAKSEIDYVRGVNSGFILRNLLVRGLVERVQNEKDSRSFLYRPSFDLLQHLGLSKIEDLPEFDALRGKMEEALSESAPSALPGTSPWQGR